MAAGIAAEAGVAVMSRVTGIVLDGWQSLRAHEAPMPTALSVTGEKIRLRSIVTPEKAQKIILQRLGIDIPRRMRIPEFASKCSGDLRWSGESRPVLGSS